MIKDWWKQVKETIYQKHDEREEDKHGVVMSVYPLGLISILEGPNARHVFCGAASGAIATTITAPLDFVKTSLQSHRIKEWTQNCPHFRALEKEFGLHRYFHSSRILTGSFRRDGIKGCFRGLGTSLIAIVPTWAIYFGCYDNFKELSSKYISNSFLISLNSSFCAGLLTNIATNPLWVLKIRLQTSPKTMFQGIVQTAKYIYQNEGIHAFSRGVSLSLLGTLQICIQFPLYEYLKTPEDSLSSLAAYAAISKTVASVLTYPHEMLRTRLQEHIGISSLSLIPTARDIITKEGVSALYKGMFTSMIKTVPSCAITLSVYDTMSSYLSSRQ